VATLIEKNANEVTVASAFGGSQAVIFVLVHLAGIGPKSP
jgi:hypothetical protein